MANIPSFRFLQKTKIEATEKSSKTHKSLSDEIFSN